MLLLASPCGQGGAFAAKSGGKSPGLSRSGQAGGGARGWRTVVDRPVAVADAQLAPGLQRLPDVGLGARDRLPQRDALGQQRGDGGRQRAPGAMRVRRLDARAPKPRDAGSIDRMSTASSPLPCPPLSSTRRAERAAARACSTASPRSRPAGTEQRAASGMFGVMSVASGNSSGLSAAIASGCEQHIAAGRHHHRIDDERESRRRAQPAATATTMAALASMPVLIAPTSRSTAPRRAAP